MYFCAAEKQIRTVFVLDSTPFAQIRRSKTLKETHNYVVAENKSRLFF